MMDRIELIKGDITKQKTDAIVNAANSSLMGGGGVDGAIHKAGGPAILDECRKIIAKQGSCKTGEAVITTGGFLPAKFVIHTVGPVWNGGNNNEAGNKIETIAFPNISTGIYSYPKEAAAKTAIQSVTGFLQSVSSIKRICFVCYDDENFLLYKLLLSQYS
jgi:O-acetyl-ADP-ribose deacetylase (regulator of RNase III)